MKSIRHKIAVLSGKGGVGKSTVSTNLAYGLALRDYRVGILDVDIHGPNIGKMLGIEERRFSGSEDEIEAVEVLPNLKAASVGFVGYDPRAALIWRGPMKLGIIKQFLEDVVWGELDYMVIDTPPGTGDEPLTICQYLPELAGAVVVSTPQDVALLDAQKSVDFAAKMKIPVLGIIENMRDPENGPKLFGSGGGERAAEKLGVPFLGAIPLDPGVVESGDSGRPIVASEAPSSSAIAAILDQILDQIPVS
jgi:Mrp family chromosome partitioning ATPase